MKLDLIYYKHVLDMALAAFVKQHDGCFSRDKDSYVLGLNVSKQCLRASIEQCIRDSVRKLADSFANGNDVLLVIGSCYPKDNMLLDFKDDEYFPKKLSSLIGGKPALKWLMAEKDIEIDIDLFNEMFIDIFNENFNRQEPKRSSIGSRKIIYVAHSRLDCYMVFKTIKWAYGSSNCCNVWKEHLSSCCQNLVAVNDLISKYVHNKSRMNKSLQFKQCALEVKGYLDGKLGMKG